LIENSQILERVSTLAVAREPACKFQEAVLTGRRLMLRYVDKTPLFSVDGEDFYGGLHFANSEVGGESAVRAATVIWSKRTSGYALGRYIGGRMPHVGRDFSRRISRLFNNAASAEQDARYLEKRVRALKLNPLQVTMESEEKRQAQILHLVRILAEHDVPQAIGVKVIATALQRRITLDSLRRDQPSATDYDVFSTLTREARPLYATARETVEQAAYKLMIRKLTFT
jgi:hypothetical protein